ncbi:mitochondrial DNA primase [Angomonas deanei]|nr:mitochondrial DNA primase [Angomonas deanei]|eukprot:EPY35893.1 mitochondrial DNA primase [Angomonas deanei]
MVKGFKIEEVASLCTSGDALFARRLPSGGCQFFAWPGTPLAIASNAITSMPDTIRTVHAVFGRKNTPIDIVVDVDCPVPQEHWSMHKIRPYQLQVMETVCSVLKEEVEKIGEQIETQVVLNSPNLKKASFHIHTKLKDVAFRDYDSLHGFLAGFHQRIPTVDLQIYRPNGMLRMFSSMKENHTSAMVVFEDARWNIGFPNGVVPPEAAALHSVCIREPGTYSRLLTFTPPAAKPFEPRTRDNNNYNADLSKDAYEEGDVQETVKIIPVPLPYSKQEAIDNASRWLRAATEFEVMEWRQWVSLGITAFRVAYHFRDANLKRPAMDEMLDAWVEASRQCPTKFKPGDCERHWATFDVEKLAKGGEADWWLAYQRLGRLQVSGKENIALDEERRAKRHRRP